MCSVQCVLRFAHINNHVRLHLDKGCCLLEAPAFRNLLSKAYPASFPFGFDGHILIIVWYMSVGSFQRPTGEDKLRSGYSHTKGSAGEGELGLSLSLGLASGGNRLARHRASQAGM